MNDVPRYLLETSEEPWRHEETPMPVKTLRPPSAAVFHIECKGCGAVLEYSRADIVQHDSTALGGNVGDHVECPHCKRMLHNTHAREEE